MMLRIGYVDLDTSHPAAFTKILRAIPGVEVTACWDGGTVWPKGYAQTFASENGIPRACESLDELIEHVDVAFVLGCNWDLHVERARPLVEAGKGVFIDKPMVGNLRDLHTIQEWVSRGARVVGGSSLRHCKEVTAFRERGDIGRILNAFVSTGVDFYNYGIHAVEMALGLVGSGVRSVRHLGASEKADLFHINYGDGRQIVLQLVAPGYHFHASVTTSAGLHVIEASTDGLYTPMLHNVVSYFKGEKPFPFTVNELLESCLVGIACRTSQRTGQLVWLDDLREDNPGHDGAAFATEYRIAKLRTVK